MTDNIDISPILELYKGKIYLKFINIFIKDCIYEFGTHIFSIKKSLTRTLTNLLSSWMFNLYITYDYSDDYSLPNNYNNTESIKTTLFDLCKYDICLTNIEEKIEKIIFNLKKNYLKMLNLLNDYKKSTLYFETKLLYNITKKKIIIKKNNNQTYFYKYFIKMPYFINNIKLKKILNNIIIPENVYDKLFNNFTLDNKDNIDIYIWVLIFRYQILGSNNHQLSILPNIINNIIKDYDLNYECFASGINFTCKEYYSIYYDIEQYFGSQGNFFNLNIKSGTYLLNPPFQKDVINISINNILKYLQSDYKLTFIITIPIWDIEGINKMKLLYDNINLHNCIDYGEFEICNIIKESKFLKYIQMIPKEKFTYIDHNFNLFKNKTIQNTYLIVLSNTDFNDSYIKSYNYDI